MNSPLDPLRNAKSMGSWEGVRRGEQQASRWKVGRSQYLMKSSLKNMINLQNSNLCKRKEEMRGREARRNEVKCHMRIEYLTNVFK